MNRCMRLSPYRAVVLLLALMSAAACLRPLPASAQEQAVRQFPVAAKRGMLVVTAPPEVRINGTAERLSPGVRIRGVNNMLVMSASLVGQTFVVNYVREKQGMIQEVWLLNQAEADEKRKGSEPITNFVFGSSEDQPKTDDGKTPFNQLPKFPKQ
jgi:hypothetical protein